MSFSHNRPPFLSVKSLDKVSLKIWQITQIFLPLDSSSITPHRNFLEHPENENFSNEILFVPSSCPAVPISPICCRRRVSIFCHTSEIIISLPSKPFREAILRKIKEFLWNHLIKWWHTAPVLLLWSPYLFFSVHFFSEKKRWFWRLFEGCFKGVWRVLQGVWSVFEGCLEK